MNYLSHQVEKKLIHWLRGLTLAIGLVVYCPEFSLLANAVETTVTAAEFDSIEDVRALLDKHAEQNLKIRLAGQVVFAHPAEHFIYITDATSGIKVSLELLPNTPSPEVGSQVKVEGYVSNLNNTSQFNATHLEVTGFYPLPQPQHITFQQANAAGWDAKWVEIKGSRQGMRVENDWLTITLATSLGDFHVSIPTDQSLSVPVGSILSVKGVCVNWYKPNGEFGGFFVFSPNILMVDVIKMADHDPFASPEIPIQTLRQNSINQQELNRYKIRGTVLYQKPGESLIIQNETGVIKAITLDEGLVKPGDMVDVAGMPGFQEGRLVLRRATFKLIKHGLAPEAIQISDYSKPDITMDCKLVQIQGRIIEINRLEKDSRLYLATDKSVTTVIYEGYLPDIYSNRWEPQSEVKILGLYMIRHRETGSPEDFYILLRNPEDLTLIKSPPWLNARRILFILSFVAVIGLITLGEILFLRKRIRNQTQQIRQQFIKEAELEDENRKIIETASDLICTTDKHGAFQSVNQAGLQILKYSEHEMLQMNMEDLIQYENPDDLTTFKEKFENIWNGEPVRIEIPLCCKDQSIVWFEFTLQAMKSDLENQIILGIGRDMSQRRELELKLRQARDLAESVNQAKSSFLANMSHEIRTPMNGIIGMSNLLMETELGEEQKEYSQTIRSSAEALLTILNDILDFSKIEAGKLELESIAFDLPDNIDTLLKLLHEQSQKKNIQIGAFISSTMPRSYIGDSVRIRQVLLNLIGNAIKFTESGHVHLEIHELGRINERIWVRFEVIDTGIGMTEEQISKLFRPFTQADISTTRQFGGTGLGLSISRQIIELMEGKIGVVSEQGKGSTFWFELPLKPISQKITFTPLFETNSGKPKNILIIHPREYCRDLIARYLQSWGFVTELICKLEDLRNIPSSHSFDGFMIHVKDASLSTAETIDFINQTANPKADCFYMFVNDFGTKTHHTSKESFSQIQMISLPLCPTSLHQKLSTYFHFRRGETGAQKSSSRLISDFIDKHSFSALRLLLVEDNLVNRRVAELILNKFGIQPSFAENGLQAVNTCSKREFDAILMDCQMPIMDGYEATRRIRQSGLCSKSRIIAMTAHVMSGDKEKCLACGMDDYLGKPLRFGELQRVLQGCIQSTAK